MLSPVIHVKQHLFAWWFPPSRTLCALTPAWGHIPVSVWTKTPKWCATNRWTYFSYIPNAFGFSNVWRTFRNLRTLSRVCIIAYIGLPNLALWYFIYPDFLKVVKISERSSLTVNIRACLGRILHGSSSHISHLLHMTVSYFIYAPWFRVRVRYTITY